MWTELLSQAHDLLQDPRLRAGAIMAAAIVVAFFLRLFISRWILFFARHTRTDVDDEIALALRRPVFGTVLLLGAAWSLQGFTLSEQLRFVTNGLLETGAVLIWAGALMRISSVLLLALSRHAGRLQLVQPRTLPLFDILAKVLIVGGAAYFAFLAWEINVTGWLASAGIVGIAVGFAAKDTLANLFAGIFILADAPYKIGDFIVLDGGDRGRVTDIGIRSTRLLTRDDIEVTIPNAVIANSRITNESGGPHEKERVRVTVGVAYGSDVDQVREVLLSCFAGVEHVCSEPAPRVRFRELGDSGLIFQLLVWIDEPVLRGRVIDQLNTRVYKGLNAAGIEIPYPKRDLYIRQMPGQS